MGSQLGLSAAHTGPATTWNFFPPTATGAVSERPEVDWARDVVVGWLAVVPVVVPSLSVRWGTSAAASVERPSRTSITISRRLAAITWGRGQAPRSSQRYGRRAARRLARPVAGRGHAQRSAYQAGAGRPAAARPGTGRRPLCAHRA